MEVDASNTWSSIAWRSFGFASVWLILAGPELSSWLIGLPSVALATWVSFRLIPPFPYRLSARGLTAFVGYFLRESLSGGWDVAMRTLTPRLRIAPQESHYTTSLPEGLPVVLFAAFVSLLPGTLTRRFEDKHLALHLLDGQAIELEQLKTLEQKIAAMLGITLEKSHV